MKRILFLLAVLLCAAVLAACGKTAADADPARTDAPPDGGGSASGEEIAEIIVDWSDFILFGGRYYQGAPEWHGEEMDAADVGEQIGSVLHPVPRHVTSLPIELEDGTSFINPIGTPLYAVRGRPVEEAIAAGVDGKFYLYLYSGKE